MQQRKLASGTSRANVSELPAAPKLAYLFAGHSAQKKKISLEPRPSTSLVPMINGPSVQPRAIMQL
jgi:hypothetical protein